MKYNLYKNSNLLKIFRIALCQILTALIFTCVSYAGGINTEKITFRKTADAKSKSNVSLKISGSVTDQTTGEKLIGVSVMVKGSNNGTVTDVKGNFILTVPDNATLVVSYIGYNTAEIPVSGKNTINIKLQALSKGLNEVIVVGYGTQKKVTVTGAVASVKGTDLEKSPTVKKVYRF